MTRRRGVMTVRELMESLRAAAPGAEVRVRHPRFDGVVVGVRMVYGKAVVLLVDDGRER